MNKYIPPPKELTPGSTVDVYLRDSGGEGQERSVESQLSEVREYCAAHRLKLRTIYRDEARSGRGMIGRSQFDSMIEEYKTQRANPRGLLIWDYARFARNTKDAIYSIATIEHHKVIIHSLIDFIPEGEFRDLGRAIKHMGNQAESEKNSAAVKRMQHQLVKKYRAMFGIPPRGFAREPLPPVRNDRTGEMRTLHKWIPDPAIAPLILRAFEMRAAGSPISEIHKATGLYKSINCYTTFYTNKLYKGVLQFGDELIEDYCEPIIPPELWDRVNAIRKDTKPGNHTKDPRRVNSRFLLSGLVHCQQCGGALVGHSVGKHNYYICATRKRSRTCNAPHIPKEKLERSILTAVQGLFDFERIVNLQTKITAELKRTEETTRAARLKLDRELVAVSKGIINITNAIAKRGDSDSLLEALTELEKQKQQTTAQINQLENESKLPRHKPPALKNISDQLNRIIEHGTFEEQQTLIRTFITRIIATKEIAMLYYIPIKILTRNNSGLGIPEVPPRGSWVEAQLTVAIL